METESSAPIDSQADSAYTFDELEAALVAQSKPLIPNQEIDSPQEESAPSQKAEAESDSTAELPEKLTAKALAEKLGITPKKLYDSLEIDLGDGETVTLSQYKDKAKEFHKVDTLRREVADNRVKVENELLQKRMALDNVARSRGYQLTERDMHEVRQQHQLHLQAQSALLAEIVPEFADGVTRDKGFQQINATLKEYAFSDAEIPYITDARLRKMAYDFARLRADINEVPKLEVKARVNESPKSHTKPAQQKQAAGNNRQSVELAVNKLAQSLR